MNINFRFPQNQISDWLLDYIRQELLKLHHRDKEINSADVYLKEQVQGLDKEKTCAITLSIYGDEIYVKQAANTYDGAIRSVLEEINKLVEKRLAKQNEPPEERTSTVRV